jgi:hypothetical protein
MLTKAEMPDLKQLWMGICFMTLDFCNIGSEGVKHLSKGKWSALSRISMCNQYFECLEYNNIRIEGI